MLFPSARRVVPAALLVLLASSCIFVAKDTAKPPTADQLLVAEAATPGASEAPPGGVAALETKESEAKARAKARKAEKRAHDLELARAELAIAELEAQNDERSASAKLENARRGLDEARLALEHFRARAMPRELEESQLGLDRSVQNKTEAEQELREMEATYAKDQFATDTKELVLMRHRKRLEFANRSLAIAEAEFADKRNVDLPRQLREAERKLRDAELSVVEAEVALQKAQMQNRIDLARKRWSVSELERPEDDDAAGVKKES